jgi:hypothetical protein
MLKRLLPLLAALLMATPAGAETHEIPRESHKLVVDGVEEVWKLVWTGKVQPVCSINDLEMSYTCPCSGFAYGEGGSMDLVRLRGGKELERLKIGPLFDEAEHPDVPGVSHPAILARWPTASKDIDKIHGASAALIAAIQKRKPVLVLKFADYAHNGGAAFLIQTGTLPCGHDMVVAVGTEPGRRTAHTLTSIEGPKTPLVLPRRGWELLAASPGPHRLTETQCGDHGADERTDLILAARNGKISVRMEQFTCPEDGSKPKRLN